MSTSQLSPGTVVDGRFTVGAVLRTRVGATTYEAREGEQQPIALTIYDDACFPSSLVLERSLRELRQLQGTASSRILPILAAGRHGDGVFEATPLPPERSLSQFLKAGPLALRDAAGILVQVGEALLEGQKLGVTHRNLGADVVFPSPDGVKVCGFAVGEPHGDVSLGSLPTMAPEQVEGKVVDQRTLVYNLAALMHWMLHGRPLFEGTTEAILRHHVETEPGGEVHSGLHRALGKDARLRPMMLRPFLDEIAELAGVERPREIEAEPDAPERAASPDAATPSSRGWTMFMAAAEEGAGAQEPVSEAKEAKKTPAPGPTPEAKPSTRGWTMFMNADEDDDEDDPPVAATATEAKTSADASSNTPAPPHMDEEDEAKPSTRGWTMFMTTEEAEEPDPVTKPEEPAAGDIAKPAAPVDEAKPSTRGWTMFMTADEDEDEDDPPAVAAPSERPSTPSNEATSPASASPASTSPASTSPASTSPASTAPAGTAPAPQATADEVKPSTRGWTMFMNADEDDGEGEPVPTASPGATSSQSGPSSPPSASVAPFASVTPPSPTTAGAGGAAPSVSTTPPTALDTPEGQAASGAAGAKSRGWTIFMEPVTDPAATKPPSATAPVAAPAVTPAVRPTATPATPTPSPKPPATEPSLPALAQTPVPGGVGTKKRGWTMFMNAPIPELKKPGGAGAAAPTSPGGAPLLGSQPLVQPPKVGPATATEGPATPGASDTRGWTVFGAPAPMRTPAAPPLTPPPGVRPAQRPPTGEFPRSGGTMIAEAPPVHAAPSPAPGSGAHSERSPSGPISAVSPSAAEVAATAVAHASTNSDAAIASASSGSEGRGELAIGSKRTGLVVAGVVIGIGLVASLVVWLLG